MAIFTKNVCNLSPEQIRQEVRLQTIASSMGVSPAILSTDYATYIHMEKAGPMCIADKYGEDIEHLSDWIKEEIVEHLWTLYSCCNIQYIDITPYNFIEQDGRIWVIDFGDAFRNKPKTKLHPFLKSIFDSWKLTKWNPEFK